VPTCSRFGALPAYGYEQLGGVELPQDRELDASNVLC
jgi:hypothetical protein